MKTMLSPQRPSIDPFKGRLRIRKPSPSIDFLTFKQQIIKNLSFSLDIPIDELTKEYPNSYRSHSSKNARIWKIIAYGLFEHMTEEVEC